jgi:hypothetical protein
LTELELLLAAAICQTGMAALLTGTPVLKGVELRLWSEATASVPVPLLMEAGFGVVASANELPLVLALVDVAAGEDPMPELRPYGFVLVVAPGFILCPIKVFRLFSSVFSSLHRLSVVSFCPSIALGIRSLSPRTSSLILRDSSSRLLLEVFNSLITLSTSVSAASSLSVRACSDDFNSSVSFASWSRRENAFSNESSIAFLSDSSCGGVGGAIMG